MYEHWGKLCPEIELPSPTAEFSESKVQAAGVSGS